jgi:hypothetical protein
MESMPRSNGRRFAETRRRYGGAGTRPYGTTDEASTATEVNELSTAVEASHPPAGSRRTEARLSWIDEHPGDS